MHRRSFKRAREEEGGATNPAAVFDPKVGRTVLGATLSEARRRSEDLFHRTALAKQADEDRVFYQARRNAVVDNADRSLLPAPYDLYFHPTRRLDRMRILGDQRAARLFRHTTEPPAKDLFFPNLYDPVRNVYRCMNCGKLATPQQLATWFNPGYDRLDTVMALGIQDDDPWLGSPVSLSRSSARLPVPSGPGFTNPVVATAYARSPDSRLIGIPLTHRPTVVVCSRACAEEQRRFNFVRRHKLASVRSTEAVAAGTHPPHSQAWFDDIWNNNPAARVPVPYTFFSTPNQIMDADLVE